MLAILLASATFAQSLGRSLDGARVTATAETAVVFFSMDCADCGERMNALEDSGVPVVLVNTDPVGEAASLRTFARRHALTSPIIPDAAENLQRQFQITSGVVLLDQWGIPVWRQDDTGPALAAMLDGASPLSIAHH